MVVNEEFDNVGGLGCHGDVVQGLTGREAGKQVWCNHHGDVSQVHLVYICMVGDLLTKFHQTLKERERERGREGGRVGE